ncbi:MAG: hypothetical protein ACTSRG_02985 [Candidatus Helarchaeota archaeon]
MNREKLNKYTFIAALIFNYSLVIYALFFLPYNYVSYPIMIIVMDAVIICPTLIFIYFFKQKYKIVRRDDSEGIGIKLVKKDMSEGIGKTIKQDTIALSFSIILMLLNIFPILQLVMIIPPKIVSGWNPFALCLSIPSSIIFLIGAIKKSKILVRIGFGIGLPAWILFSFLGIIFMNYSLDFNVQVPIAALNGILNLQSPNDALLSVLYFLSMYEDVPSYALRLLSIISAILSIVLGLLIIYKSKYFAQINNEKIGRPSDTLL